MNELPPLPSDADLGPWIEFRFDRGGGPGGQHVNKVSTRVTLLFDFEACPLVTDHARDRLRHSRSRLAADGRLRLVAQGERSQSANRAVALERLGAMLEAARHVPKPRRATSPTRGSKRRRLEAKRRASERKTQRGKPREDA